MSDTRHNEPQTSKQRRGRARDEGDLYAEHHEKLRRLVGASVSTSDANIQDACSFAWTQLLLTQPERRDSIFSWLVTVALREAWRLHRLERRDARDEQGLTLEAIPAPTAADRARLDEVVAALRTIHPRRRRMLLLYAAGFSCREIASEYGISEERARMLVYRARLQLRARTERD